MVTFGNNYHNTDDDNDSSTYQTKKLVVENQYPKIISHLQFGLLSSEEMQRLAEFQISSRELYSMPARKPAIGGCIDPRLGISDKVSSCATCKLKLVDCAGHFGYIKLALPVYHIGFFKHTLNVLQVICKSCSRILLSNKEQEATRRKMKHPHADVLMKSSTFKKTLDRCKKVKICPHCHGVNGTTKKVGAVPTLKIVHEKYTKAGKYSQDEMEELMTRLQTALGKNDEIQNALGAVVEDLLPTKALQLFQRIPKSDVELLWMDALLGGRPENLILQTLLVPPVPIRPSVSMDIGGSNEDDLTVKLKEIMDVNVALDLALESGPLTKTIMEEWDFLQMQVAQYINGDTPGMSKPIGVKPIRGFCQRLKGKQGRFRGNLSGKRVDFSGRTVISPDPNLSVEQVGVPRHVAKVMTYPEMVTRYNIDKLRQCVRNGPDEHPGANQIRLAGGTGFIKSLAFGDKLKAAATLRIGDIVERHMEDGDVVLFNRQPSLHKMSIMSHRVKVLEWRTFRFNIQVCAPYNADFDGDEMNMHLPQTEEARAEAAQLMSVRYNLVTGRNGEPLVAASQDFLTASYLVTQKNVFWNRETFCQLVSSFSDASEEVHLPIPAIIKPVPLWTGKQLFSMILCPNKTMANKVNVNFDMKEKTYDSKAKQKHFCPEDGWICFRNSQLLSGTVAKKTIGGGGKSGLLYILLRDVNEEAACDFMDRFSKLCSRLMGHFRGFSMGIEDVTPSDDLKSMKYDILTDGYEKATENIRLYNENKLELRPGCNQLQSLEEKLNGVLGKLRESAGQEAVRRLSYHNAPRIMATCGSKGSSLNISQMMSCVGQQAVGGNRIENGFVDRTLPHFEYHSLTPSAKGFVANSFYTGLSPTEFFFHTMGGREGLVDTAVKTAETGYMARRLMKALEDLSLQYDTTVRNSENTVVQFIYGDDNLNPQMMEDNDRPVDLNRLHLSVIETHPSFNEIALYKDELIQYVQTYLKTSNLVQFVHEVFLQEIHAFFKEIVKAQEDILSHYVATMHTSHASDVDREHMLFQQIWKHRFTKMQLDTFLHIALDKYCHALVEPGEAIGATGAQSISEPGTQMTLKTFHFAGVSSMNVTLGVPRLKEIINASKNISTPIITAKLVQDNNKISARVVKAVIEKTTLGEVATHIKEIYAPGKCYMSVQLDLQAIEQLKLGIDAFSVRNSILRGSRGVTRPPVLRSLKEHHVTVKKGSKSKIRILVPDSSKMSTYFTMQALKTSLPQVIVQGIPTVNRAVINEEAKDGKTSYHLLVEGYGLAEVMGSPGIDGRNTTTNHIIEVEKTLGVEAARTQISSEISYIMNAYGIGIDVRHLMLLSDIMSFKGEILGITRYGVTKMRESVLMLASFEKTTDHLFDAAVHGRTDAITGVSECIIMGIPIPIGTGAFKLLRKPDSDTVVSRSSSSIDCKNGDLSLKGDLESNFNGLLLN